jgi:hypothetical protein
MSSKELKEAPADKLETRPDSKCGNCFKKVTSDGVLCEICNVWFHSKCQHISDQLYRALDTYHEDVHWFCSGCRGGASKLLSLISRVQTKFDKLEEELVRLKLEWKQELTRTETDLRSQWQYEASRIESAMHTSASDMQQKVNGWERRLEESLSVMGGKMETMNKRLDADKPGAETGPKWSEIVSKSSAVENKLEGMAAEMQTLQRQTDDIVRDRIEQEEQNKRKNCVVIQGLKEPQGNTAEERHKQDSDNITDLLHQIQCDMVSVSACFRLGKTTEDPAAKPRPVKLVLASEAQKQQVLQLAKNLKGKSNGLSQVFIHQDLTPKQRVARQALVKVLKERQSRGEQNLIIVGDSIVTRRPRTEPTAVI